MKIIASVCFTAITLVLPVMLARLVTVNLQPAVGFHLTRPDGSNYLPIPATELGPSLIYPFHGYIRPDNSTDALLSHPSNAVTSPLSTAMAIIRLNTARPERLPLLQKYEPFFHTVHISMRDTSPSLPDDFQNITHDQYYSPTSIHVQVARTMQIILDQSEDITGIFYFHFDAWIDPLAFGQNNLENMWFPTTGKARNYTYMGPNFLCMNDTKDWEGWWAFDRGHHLDTLDGLRELEAMNLGYQFRADEWCIGWSDLYYIPRRFFRDFIFLTGVLSRGGRRSLHEIAIPTILHIIDQSRRSSPFTPILEQIGDCFGSCCDDTATPHDVIWARCGHRLNYLNDELVRTHFGRLDEEAAQLHNTLKK